MYVHLFYALRQLYRMVHFNRSPCVLSYPLSLPNLFTEFKWEIFAYGMDDLTKFDAIIRCLLTCKISFQIRYVSFKLIEPEIIYLLFCRILGWLENVFFFFYKF